MRLNIIAETLTQVIVQYNPLQMSLEEIFVNINPSSSIKLAYARGVVLLTAEQNKIPVYEYSARMIKKAITGSGASSKESLYKVIKLINNTQLQNNYNHDISDALAIAMCHFYNNKNLAKYKNINL